MTVYIYPLVVLSPADRAACCPPLSQVPLSAEQAEQVAPLLKALAEPVRLRLMSLVASHPGGAACGSTTEPGPRRWPASAR
jgi:ArsR family transcriptional regulator